MPERHLPALASAILERSRRSQSDIKAQLEALAQAFGQASGVRTGRLNIAHSALGVEVCLRMEGSRCERFAYADFSSAPADCPNPASCAASCAFLSAALEACLADSLCESPSQKLLALPALLAEQGHAELASCASHALPSLAAAEALWKRSAETFKKLVSRAAEAGAIPQEWNSLYPEFYIQAFDSKPLRLCVSGLDHSSPHSQPTWQAAEDEEAACAFPDSTEESIVQTFCMIIAAIVPEPGLEQSARLERLAIRTGPPDLPGTPALRI